MSVSVQTLDVGQEAAYRQLLLDTPAAMFNHSLEFRGFLSRLLPGARSRYFLARRGGDLLAALPSFSFDGEIGPVVNSLPFYGSHGGLVGHYDAESARALFSAFDDHCRSLGAWCSTIIEPALDAATRIYDGYGADIVDHRIGQVTHLPRASAGQSTTELIFKGIHQKTRNVVRKAQKGGFEVFHDGSESTLRALCAMHEDNMRAIGGLAKPWAVFSAIRQSFRYGSDYRVYAASHDGHIIAALLLFYFKDSVEYFIPATEAEFRPAQPMSLLIFRAMQDAIEAGNATLWNWGGTWLSQDGVYRFKSRWGAKDYPYRYHVKLHRGTDMLQHLSRERLLQEYRYFFTVPFSCLPDVAVCR